MKAKRKWRILPVVSIVLGVSSAAALALYALRQNIDLYYTPSQVFKKHVPMGQTFRLGGQVKKGSLKRTPHSLRVSFILQDYHQRITVRYTGMLPVLFREGQGIIAEGRLTSNNVFIADQVLAKHDEKYKPPTAEDSN